MRLFHTSHIAADAAIVLAACLAPTRSEGDDQGQSSQRWPQGDVTAFQKMAPEDIVQLQVLRIDPLGKRHDLERPITVDSNRAEIEALLAMLGRATAFRMKAGVPWEPALADRVLVVHPAEDEPFEFEYSADFGEPFAGLRAADFKQALFALSGSGSRFAKFPITILHFDKNQVQKVIRTHAIAPHRGETGGTVTAKLRLTAKEGFTLYLRVHELRGKTLMEDKKQMRFGDAKVFDAKVFDAKEPGNYIVLLHGPRD
jgi:hypothetical protein